MNTSNEHLKPFSKLDFQGKLDNSFGSGRPTPALPGLSLEEGTENHLNECNTQPDRHSHPEQIADQR
jgi:hypothetical protein